MAIIPISRNYPRPLAWEDRARNGKVPDWRLVAGATYRTLFALTHCRKLLFHKVLTPGSTTASAAGTKTPWRWQCRTGESNDSGNTVIMFAEAQVLPSDSSSGTDPRWRFFAGGTNSSYRRYPAVVAAPTYDDVISQYARINGLTPNTEYQCGLEVEDYGRVVSLTVWEVVPIEANSAATYVSGSYQTIGNTLEITDAQHTEFATDPLQIWKHNGAQYFNIVPDDEDNPWTTASASYVNMLDATHSTTVSANTAGVNVGAQYHNPTHSDTFNAIWAVYAKSATGGLTDDIILKDSSGVLGTLSDFNNTGEWKSVAVSIDGSIARHKMDIQFRDTDTDTFTVYASSLYAYVA
jgi:hypothetical protein